MKYYAVCIRETDDHILKDSVFTKNGTETGMLVFKKKRDAMDLAEEMNLLRKNMKTEQVYSVCRVDTDDWKGHHFIIDHKEEDEYDIARRNVQRYTKREVVHDGSDGSDADSKGSKERKRTRKGKTQTLPL